MNRRTLLAIAISFLVITFYPRVMMHFFPGLRKSMTVAEKPAVQKTPAQPQAAAIQSEISGDLDAAADIPVRLNKMNVQINPRGGVVRGVSFPGFRSADGTRPLVLFSAKDLKDAPGLLAIDNGRVSTHVVDYSVSAAKAGTVVATGQQDGLSITKTFQFDDQSYGARLKIRFENPSGAQASFRYALSAGGSFPERHPMDLQYKEANFCSLVDGKTALRHVREYRPGRPTDSKGPVEWVAVKDRHFSVILKPAKGAPAFSAVSEGLGQNRLKASLLSAEKTLAPGASLEEEFIFYAGPNEIRELEPYELDAIVNFGKLDGIGKILLGLLEMLHRVVGNYGLAILALTFLINLLLFPLTRVSYMSMKRMQLIQPQMAKLKEKYKNQPEKQHAEMMELYKKHKVNPFGGCLPMLLQMPVFIALYVTLSKAVVLLDQRFLWIQDLASPDRLALPVSLPLVGQELHVLPILLVGASVLQQKFMKMPVEGQDPSMEAQQKMMSYMMPVFLGFIFYSMSSGYVLYFLANTLLMSLYQMRLRSVTLA